MRHSIWSMPYELNTALWLQLQCKSRYTQTQYGPRSLPWVRLPGHRANLSAHALAWVWLFAIKVVCTHSTSSKSSKRELQELFWSCFHWSLLIRNLSSTGIASAATQNAPRDSSECTEGNQFTSIFRGWRKHSFRHICYCVCLEGTYMPTCS